MCKKHALIDRTISSPIDRFWNIGQLNETILSFHLCILPNLWYVKHTSVNIFGRKSDLRLTSHLYVCVFHRAIPRSRTPALLFTLHPVKWVNYVISDFRCKDTTIY